VSVVSRGRDAMHQDRHLTERLDELKARVLVMGGLAEERLQVAMRGLVERDQDALADVIAGDARIDELQIEIDERCFTLLALHQPVAVDLRTVLSALKINADLERVGDLAVNICEAAQRYVLHPPVKPLIDLPRMGTLALKMLREALDAFVSRDVSLAQAVLRQDDWLDALKDQIFRELLTYMLGDSRTLEPAVELILISRHLERVGDHATNIAEDVIFIVEARDVRHRAANPGPAPDGPVAGTTVERRRDSGGALV
jgi:phosphate transport system protein